MERAKPSVAVVVPSFNEIDHIEDCIRGLEAQTYPESLREFVVVDNGSTDGTRETAADMGVRVVDETAIQSSYAARNRGLAETNSEVVAFLDADCVPHERWLAAGIDALETDGADLAGGKVTFTFPRGGTAAERFDSINNMQMAQNVEERSVAKTANLFVRRDVVDDVGGFPNHLISGGDVFWTKKATDAGYDLVYAPEAEVEHPARGFGSLLKKQFRVGRGQIQTWRLDPITPSRCLALLAWLLVGLLPKPPHYLSQDLERTDTSVGRPEFVQILLVAWACRLAEDFGRLNYLLFEWRDNDPST